MRKRISYKKKNKKKKLLLWRIGCFDHTHIEVLLAVIVECMHEKKEEKMEWEWERAFTTYKTIFMIAQGYIMRYHE